MYKQIVFECKCQVKSTSFSGMAQSEIGELVVTWFCTGDEEKGIEGCGKQCFAVVAGMKPVLEFPKPLFTEEDKAFLHSCNMAQDALKHLTITLFVSKDEKGRNDNLETNTI